MNSLGAIDKEMDGLYDVDRELFVSGRRGFHSGEKDTAILFYVHCLPSFFKLLDYMVRSCGFASRNIFLLPKSYSAIPSAVEQCQALGIDVFDFNFDFSFDGYDEAAVSVIKSFIDNAAERLRRRHAVRRVVLVDDGGFLTRHWSRRGYDEDFETVSVQQTASGIYFSDQESSIPRIDVARSAAKREFESKIIALGVVRKIRSSMSLRDLNVGIAGIGAIGSALAEAVAAERPRGLFLFDKISERSAGAAFELNVDTATSVRTLLEVSQVVFGCTGSNFCHAINPDEIQSSVSLISCSSRNKEFLAFLSNSGASGNGKFSKVAVGKGRKLRIINGGFPINFDREREWEEPHEILIVRNLILAAIFQAMTIPRFPISASERRKWIWSQNYWKIEPAVQRYIVGKWFDYVDPSTRKRFPNPYSLPVVWWDENSAGESATAIFGKSLAESG